jgi:hypothetical protein
VKLQEPEVIEPLLVGAGRRYDIYREYGEGAIKKFLPCEEVSRHLDHDFGKIYGE